MGARDQIRRVPGWPRASIGVRFSCSLAPGWIGQQNTRQPRRVWPTPGQNSLYRRGVVRRIWLPPTLAPADGLMPADPSDLAAALASVLAALNARETTTYFPRLFLSARGTLLLARSIRRLAHFAPFLEHGRDSRAGSGGRRQTGAG